MTVRWTVEYYSYPPCSGGYEHGKMVPHELAFHQYKLLRNSYKRYEFVITETAKRNVLGVKMKQNLP